MCYNFKACYILNDKVYHSGNDTLCRRIEQEKINYENMFRDINGDWCLAGRKIGILKGNGLAMKLKRGASLETEIFYYFIHNRKEYLVLPTDVYEIATGNRQRISDDWIHPALYNGKQLFFVNYRVSEFIESWIFENGSFRFQRKNRMPSRIHQLSLGPDGNIICCSDKGILIYDTATGRLSKDTTIPDHLFTRRTLLDREGNQWFGTVNDGVYLKLKVTPYLIDRKSGLSNNNIKSIYAATDGTLVAGDDMGNVNLIEKRGIRHIPVTKRGLQNRIKFVYFLNHNEIIAGGDRGVFRVGFLQNSVSPYSGVACKTGVLKDKYCLWGDPRGATRCNVLTGQKEALWDQRTTAIEEDSSGIIWMGTLNGLYYTPATKYTGTTKIRSSHKAGSHHWR